MKKPFLRALGAAAYIVVIVLVVNVVTHTLKAQNESIIIPMTMLSLFVLSAAVMGYLFLSEPLYLLTENKKQEAIVFFFKTVGFFACFVALFAILLFLNPMNQIQYDGDGFSIQIPKDFKVDENYTYQNLGPGKEINGVKFTIPSSVASGTNLSSDSYISVEKLPAIAECTANLFLTGETGGGSVASTTGAAAGNRYEETVYALPGTNPCVAVRYFIHYGSIQNYPEGAVREFDKKSLLDQFDQIRKSLEF